MREAQAVIQVIRSRRKTLSIQIEKAGRILVRAPLGLPEAEIRRFVEEKRGWIEKHLVQVSRREEAARQASRITPEEMHQLGNEALAWFPPRVRFFAERLGIRYGRITIRNQKTRWGSCSSAGNLNFNCLLMLCPEEVRDYVIVHELCHRKEMNHSPRFWAEVEKVLPEYRKALNWLKTEGQVILARAF